MGIATRSCGLLAGMLILLPGCTMDRVSPTPLISALQPPVAIATPSAHAAHSSAVEQPSAENRPPDASDPVETGPLVPYMLTPTETAELHYAFDAMVGVCMRSFGASWAHESLADYRRAAQDVTKYTMSWEYGITDTQHRYTGSPPSLPTTTGNVDNFLLQGRRDPRTGGPPALETLSPGTVNGRAVPPGGCQGQAWRALADEGGIGWGSSSVHFWSEAVVLTRQQPGYPEAVRPWRECMKSRGFTVTDPINDTGDIAAAILRGTSMGHPYPEETALAEADVDCKSQTGLVEHTTPLRMAAQQQVLDQNRDALEADRRMLDDKVARARAWISENGAGAGD